VSVDRLLRGAVRVLALPVLLVTAWWFASAGSTSYYQPPLATIVRTFPGTWLGDRVTADIVPSLWRLLAGFALAVAIGTALGVLIGSLPWLRALTEPVLEFLRAVPPPIVVPILILIAGIGDGAKVLIIVSGGVWPVLLNAVEGVRAADEVLADTCRTYRIGGWLRLRRFVLPGAAPQLVTGARQALSISIIMMVISEILASTNGLGHTVLEFQRGFEIPEMWGGVLLLGAIGVLLSFAFAAVERQVLRWYHGVRAAGREA
jgi:ABC-type nitrate/sulfonate/bicarbonate transport system permease component